MKRYLLPILLLAALLAAPGAVPRGQSALAASGQTTRQTPHGPTLPNGTGDLLHTTYFSQPCTTAGTGVAFDGKYLWYSCSPGNILLKANALSGAVLISFTPNIGKGYLSALAWDRNRKKLWAGVLGYHGGLYEGIDVYLIDPTTGSATLVFGLPAPYLNYTLAYDPQDDTLYLGTYPDYTVVRFDTSGAEMGNWTLGYHPLGLAIAGDLLYVAHTDYAAGKELVTAYDKAGGTLQFQFDSNSGNDFDLECDSVTFAPLTALWAVYQWEPRQATAYEIPAADCKGVVYYWDNPAGGSWHKATNWDPQGDPGDGDTVIFALNGQYTVDASVVSAASPTANFPVGRAIISGTSTVEFVNLSLNLLDDSVTEPALTVNDGGTVKITSGAGSLIHAVIGGEAPANPSNPSTAHLQVFNSGTFLTGMGRLTIGDAGPGDLFVANGGHLNSVEARLGGLLPTATGAAVVGGDGSLWQTGNIAVGYGVSGTLTIESGGRVDSNDAYVSFGVLSDHSQVTVEGAGLGASQASLWALSGSLTVGQTGFGSVEVLNGGDLYVGQNVQIKNGALNIEGRRANGDPSDLDVFGSVFVGGAGSANLLALRNAAKGDIEGDLIIGQDGTGAMILWGSAVTANPTRLDVVDPQAGLCAIGRQFDGGVSLDDGGLLRCRNIELGGRAGTNGSGSLTVDGGMVRALDMLRVGQVGGGSGEVDMQNNALVATNGTYIAPNGVVSGTGTLAVGLLGLQNDGTLAPGISLLYPLASAAAFRSQATTATLTISGSLTLSHTGQLRIPVTGSGAGEYGSLAVTAAANLDGALALDFRNGYAPKQGDTFHFLTATSGLTGTFDSVAISGLVPGFAYELSYVNGQLALEALNDGAPAGKIYLPLLAR